MASGNVKTLNDSTFDETLATTDGPVLVEFTATWCGPCRVQAAVLERVAAGNPELVIGAVDVDDYPELAARYGVRGMPTLVVFKGGKEARRRLGLAQDQAVVALVNGQGAAPRTAPHADHSRV
ncbi:MAG TPA: thioredoxin domain-containing protein [Polyangiaceae bacterium]|nr:thioredoxin domain-containing protein [Polyangiaceae bacterium]